MQWLLQDIAVARPMIATTACVAGAMVYKILLRAII